jgi:hypothetical protein
MSGKTSHNTNRNAWQSSYELDFGVQPTTYNKMGKVTHALCMFCSCFGRENNQDSAARTLLRSFDSSLLSQKKKRVKTCTVKGWNSFRTDHFRQHLNLEHPAKWGEYQLVARPSRNEFFVQRTINSFLQPVGKSLFIIDKSIVECISSILCNSEGAGSNWMNQYIVIDDDVLESVNVASDFQLTSDQDFVIEIRNLKQFDFIVQALATSASFRVINRMMVAFQRTSESAVVGVASEGDIGKYVRHIVGICLSGIASILKKSWAFSIATDGATHEKDGYMDVRLSVAVKGVLRNFHVLAIPMGDVSHTGVNYAHLVLKALNFIDSKCLLKLVGLTSDGASVMMGCHVGFNTLIKNQCNAVANGDKIYINWCGAHQLNLTMREQYSAFADLTQWMKLSFESNDSDGNEVMSDDKVISFMTNYSFDAYEMYSRQLTEEDKMLALTALKECISMFVISVDSIVLGISDETAGDSPPTTPKELILCSDESFMMLVSDHQHRLKDYFGEDVLNQLVKQRNEIKRNYSRNSAFKRAIDGSQNGSFETSWSSTSGCEELISFCGGLASVMAGSHTVEGDFSILKRTKSPTRSRLSNYAMEGQMQARQYDEIVKVCTDIDICTP